jgi:hypothetical protein
MDSINATAPRNIGKFNILCRLVHDLKGSFLITISPVILRTATEIAWGDLIITPSITA